MMAATVTKLQRRTTSEIEAVYRRISHAASAVPEAVGELDGYDLLRNETTACILGAIDSSARFDPSLAEFNEAESPWIRRRELALTIVHREGSRPTQESREGLVDGVARLTSLRAPAAA